jgi:23S rRNA maturation mini-RNase III
MLKVTPSLRPDIKEIIRKLRNDYSKTPPKIVNRMAYPLSRNI